MRVPTPAQFFGPGRKMVSASAPGRLDVMGGFADYSGSLVLEMPIRERTLARVAARKDGIWRAFSREASKAGLSPQVQAHNRDIETPAKARRFFSRSPKSSWAAYVLGCVPLLLEEMDLPACGADFYLESEVPLSKGLSSSASVEVASMAALGKLFGLIFGKTELPLLCQKVENLVAGAPCGLMDQLTCYLGKKDRLLPILCRPDKILQPVVVPPGVHFVGLDSGVRHWVGGSSYSDVRTAAFMGYGLISLREGAKRGDLRMARKTGNASRLPFRGYLAGILPGHFHSHLKRLMPEKMKGRDFLRVCDSIDPVTKVTPNATYPVLAATQHPIEENFRVGLFSQLLESLGKARTSKSRSEILWQMGNLMYQSHESYAACGLGEPVTDALVASAKKAGPKSGVYGAKITGGGSGGTVCFLVEGAKGLGSVRKIAKAVLRGRKSFLAQGSSDGARWS